MDKKFLNYYNIELQHLRETGEIFARENPKIAGRLGLSRFSCADPYVERLLEGFAFLAARVHQKLDAEFPRFTQAILNTVYPLYLMPTPSMAMVQFHPDRRERDLCGGITIPQQTKLKSIMGRNDKAACRFVTTHPITLWPLEISDVTYEIESYALRHLPSRINAKACLKIRLRTLVDLPLGQIDIDRLLIHLSNTRDFVPMRLYAQLFSQCRAMIVQSVDNGKTFHMTVENAPGERSGGVIIQKGFSEDEALFPLDARCFQGYRLLREYFAFPQKYMFFEINGLSQSLRQCKEGEIDIVLAFETPDNDLEKKLTASHLQLHCTPAVNLFSMRTDRIHLNKSVSEFHLVPDRTSPLDYEVMDVQSVKGYGPELTRGMTFHPFYKSSGFDRSTGEGNAYYTTFRQPRRLTEQERRMGTRSQYTGSEVYLSIVDTDSRPYSSDLRELGAQALCSNRDLPVHMSVGAGRTDFTLDINAPVRSVRCIEKPTMPENSFIETNSEWRVINHLSGNFLSLIHEKDHHQSAARLRDILKLYCNPKSGYDQRQVNGISKISSRPIVRRFPGKGPAAFIRGLEVSLHFNDDAFSETGFFLLGSILERFISACAPVNSFTETLIKTTNSGDVVRWPMRNNIHQQI